MAEFFEVGSTFVRVFNQAGGYGKTAFNPARASLTNKEAGGRFDGTTVDPYNVLYVATPGSASNVAFWERMQEEVEIDSLTGEQLMFRSKLDGLAFLHLRAVKRIRLVDIRDHRGARRFLARYKVLQGENRVLTRAWASFIRRRSPKHHGLLYRSMMSTATDGIVDGDAIVFMEPECNPGFFVENGPVEPLRTRSGLIKVKRALRGSGVRLG